MMRHPVAWSINTTAARRRHLRGQHRSVVSPRSRWRAACRTIRAAVAATDRGGSQPGRRTARESNEERAGVDPVAAATAGFGGRWQVAVPERLAGHGARRPGACASDADEPVLRIAPRHLSYRAHEGPMKAVVVRGNSRMALIAGLPGAGATWLSTTDSPLSLDGRRCVDTRSGRQRLRHRSRTPAGAPSHPPSMPAASSGVAHSPRQETS